MKTLFGVSLVLYFVKVLRGSHNFWNNLHTRPIFKKLSHDVTTKEFVGKSLITIGSEKV